MGLELSRWLRYAMPGSVFVAIVTLWGILDFSTASEPYEGFAGLGGAPGVAALAAATLPVGYVAATLSHQILWRKGGRGCCLQRIDDGAVLEAAGHGRVDDPEEQAARVDTLVERRQAEEQWALAVTRGRAMLDMMHGLAAAAVASALAVVTPWVALGSQWALCGFSLDPDRLWPALIVSLLSAGTCGTFVCNERRVSRLTTLAFAGLWPQK